VRSLEKKHAKIALEKQKNNEMIKDKNERENSKLLSRSFFLNLFFVCGVVVVGFFFFFSETIKQKEKGGGDTKTKQKRGLILKNYFFKKTKKQVRTNSSFLVAFTTETAGESEIAGHKSDALGVEGQEVGISEKPGDVGFGSFLEGHEGGGLPLHHCTRLVIRGGDFTDETLEGSLAHEGVDGALVLLDFAEGDGAGAPAELAFLLGLTGDGRGSVGLLLLDLLGGTSGLLDLLDGHFFFFFSR